MQAQLTTCASLLESPQLQFEQALEDQETSYGDSVTLLCSVYGAPQVCWMKLGLSGHFRIPAFLGCLTFEITRLNAARNPREKYGDMIGWNITTGTFSLWYPAFWMQHLIESMQPGLVILNRRGNFKMIFFQFPCIRSIFLNFFCVFCEVFDFTIWSHGCKSYYTTKEMIYLGIFPLISTVPSPSNASLYCLGRYGVEISTFCKVGREVRMRATRHSSEPITWYWAGMRQRDDPG